ncbi:bifunctional NUDIX hydrolase/histidine phosphatase family protein [Demequina sp. NBRC 110056]|uniref:NUDIX hydrolase n=1 Tax=Demequina sp. NBRC 110056 TaxID=1570345 RepID=UPI000A03640D|nr:bifunctional NUDIX hydrolase/histidine phosphatase family protein [Demequina sp. NBRC 110056]
MRRYPLGTVIAAGALVWRIRDGELQVLAVHRPRYNDWSWPKGKLDKGETLPACAIREVAEETGKQVVLGQPLPTLRYPVGGKTKVVKYWAAHVASTSAGPVKARPKVKDASKHEIDKTRWLTVEEARKKITFRDDLRPLEVLVEAYENERLDTRAFVLVRHARAKRRKAWSGEDIDRPITAAGERRAEQLVPLFAAFGARRVSSSPARRCMATVEPYAEAAGIDIKTYKPLTEPGHAAKPLDTAKTFVKLLDKPAGQLVCAHRPTLPTIVEMIRAATRPYTRGALPRKNPYLPAGGVLIAHVLDTESGPRVTAIETHLLQVHP